MTQQQKQTNKEAKKAYDEGNYYLAFQILFEKSTIHDFVTFAEKVDKEKNNWFQVNQSAEIFWDDFIIRDNVFNKVFSSESASQVFHNYFSNYGKLSGKFENKLAKYYPHVYVTSVRLNQVFLKEDRFDFLRSIDLKNEFQIHQMVWKKIYDKERGLWAEIDKELKSISKASISEILSHCVIWFEVKRFVDKTDVNIDHLSNVYSFYIDLLLYSYKEKFKLLSKEFNFEEVFRERFLFYSSKRTQFKETPHSKLLQNISNWLSYFDSVISPYCFDLNFNPLDGDPLTLSYSNKEEINNWCLDGIRYEINRQNYFAKGLKFEEDIKSLNGKGFLGKEPSDFDLNRETFAATNATLFLLNDICFESFIINKDIKIECNKLLPALISDSFNRKSRYEASLIKYNKNSNSWYETNLKFIDEAQRTNNLKKPYYFMSKREYIEMIKESVFKYKLGSNAKINEAVPYTENEINEVIRYFSYTENKIFDRFNIRYNVWEKPFLIIGENLFCPMIFFANNNWFYSFTRAVMNNSKNNPKDTERMEKNLGELLTQKGWEVKVITNIESGKMEGDVDIFVEDQNTLLFIQLKRTYLRLNLKDSYNEKINSDYKAARQLNNAEEWLQKPNEIFTVKHKPTKWIVSTSFENIREEMGGCRKINYFELLYALESSTSKTLKGFIEHVESDKDLKAFIAQKDDPNLPIEARQLVSEIVKPKFEYNKNQRIVV